jgi:hypothetical protein
MCHDETSPTRAFHPKKKKKKKQGVCHTVALPRTLKSVLRQKKELWKLKYFTNAKIY